MERISSKKNEESTMYIVSISLFYLLPWPQKVNEENKTTKVLTLKMNCVSVLFFPISFT